MSDFLNIENCEQCAALSNREAADLLKDEKLSNARFIHIGELLMCENCGTHYEEIREKDTSSDELYRNRLSMVEAIYSLEADRTLTSEQEAQKLRKTLKKEMARMEKALDAVSETLQHHFLCNLAHFHHACANKDALDRLENMGTGAFQMMLQFHRMDSPMISIKSP